MKKFVFILFILINFNVFAEDNADTTDLVNNGDAPAVITYEV